MSLSREQVIAVLRAHEAKLRHAGLLHLHLHGSIARGEGTARSDVDLAARFDKTKRLSLIDLVHLQNRLSDILGVEVDLCDADLLKEDVKTNFDREAELVF